MNYLMLKVLKAIGLSHIAAAILYKKHGWGFDLCESVIRRL